MWNRNHTPFQTISWSCDVIWNYFMTMGTKYACHPMWSSKSYPSLFHRKTWNWRWDKLLSNRTSVCPRMLYIIMVGTFCLAFVTIVCRILRRIRWYVYGHKRAVVGRVGVFLMSCCVLLCCAAQLLDRSRRQFLRLSPFLFLKIRQKYECPLVSFVWLSSVFLVPWMRYSVSVGVQLKNNQPSRSISFFTGSRGNSVVKLC